MQTSEDSSDGGFLSPDNFSCFFHQANHVLQSFLQSQIPIENSILQSDKALTANQKAMEVERAQKEAAEKEQELLRQKQKELQQVMESQERSYKENIVQLHEKMETERKNILEKQEEMLAHKLKVRPGGPLNFSGQCPGLALGDISHTSEWYRGNPGCFRLSLIIQISGKFINEPFW